MSLVEERVSRGLAEAGQEGLLLPLVPRFARFLELVLEANAQMNLVSGRSASVDVLVDRHLLDALSALPLLPPETGRPLRLLDLGSGGGFPAIPLLIARRDLEGTLVESRTKKARFLESATAALHLTARVVNARFPDPSMDTLPPFDVLTTRAVAAAGKLVRQARPRLANGARALLWTSEPLLAEIRKDSGIQSLRFHKTPGSQLRGVASLECST